MIDFIVMLVVLSLMTVVLLVGGLVLSWIVNKLDIITTSVRDAPELKALALEFQEISRGKEEQMAELERRSGCERDTDHHWWYVESTKYGTKKPLAPSAEKRRLEREKRQD